MARVSDTWHISSGIPCTDHGKPPSTSHGTGRRWQVRYRDADGRQRKESFDRKALADARATAVDNELRRGAFIDPRDQRTTFEQYAEQWRAAQPHRPGTAKDVEQSLTAYAYPAFGNRRLVTIKPSEVQGWATGMVKQGLAPSTARKNFQKAKAVFNAAVRDGLIPRSPCAGVRTPEVPHTEVQPLTAEEVSGLAGAMPERYRAMVILMAGSGLRPGEVFGLCVKHVNFLKKTVRVEQQLQQTTGHSVYTCPPKTRRSYRTVPISQTVTDALAAHLAAFPAAGPDDFLFRMVKGGPVIRTSFYGPVWTVAAVSAGLPKGTRMHALRHTYASLLIRHGEGPKTVADRLGDTVAVAMKTYAHLFPDEDQDTRDAVEDFFASAPDVPAQERRSP